MKKLYIGLVSFLALSSNAATVTATHTVAVVAAAGTASYFGFDPIPWLLSGFGAIVVYIKREPPENLPANLRKADAFVNAGLSVGLGVFGAPFVASTISHVVSPSLGPLSSYPTSLVLSAGWPWLSPVLLKLISPVDKVLPSDKGVK